MAETSIDLRLDSSKLADDGRRAVGVLKGIFGDILTGGQSTSAASMPSMPGTLLTADEQFKRESKAKASMYSQDSVGQSGLGGGGINASGSKTISINRAVIHIQQAKIHTGARGGSPTAVPGEEHTTPHPDTPTQPTEQTRVRAAGLGAVGHRFAAGFGEGEHALGAAMSGNLQSVAHLGMRGVGYAYGKFQEHRANKAATSGEQVQAGSNADANTANREGQSRIAGAISATPFIGFALGAIVSATQKLGEAYIHKLSSQMGTLGQVGDQRAGGRGALGELGYGAAQKGQMIMQAQQHMSQQAYADSMSGGLGRESAFGFSARFGHSQGMGAGAGMIMSGQLSEMYGVQKGQSGSLNAAEGRLKTIAQYASGSGVGARRLGQFAQSVIGIASQQQNSGGVGDAEAIASSLGGVMSGGHTTLAAGTHAVQSLSGMMSAGVQSGNPIAAMLSLAEAQKGGSLEDVIKAGEKGITKGGLKDLEGMVDPEMMKWMMYSQTGKLGEAGHITDAVYKKGSKGALGDKEMGMENRGTLQTAANFAHHMEQIAHNGANAAEAIKKLNNATITLAKSFDWAFGYIRGAAKKAK